MRWLLSTLVLFMSQNTLAAPSWKEIDQLASEQKVQAALEATQKRLAEAKSRRDPEEWTRALVKATQFEIALHGYETAIRTLDEQPKPDQALAQLTLGILRAESISQYANAYAHEIRQREKVDTQGTVDLRRLTWDQLMLEVQRGYATAWAAREQLGRAPLSTLEGLLVLGTFPPEVRGTMRDAITYLRVNTLENTASWRADHANEVWRLDVPALIQGEPAKSKDVKLEDPDVHPLLKIGAVLDDLEAWHRANGRKAAALEARRVRAETLHRLLEDDVHQAAIRKDFASRLASFKDVSWWSMGVWQLASFDQDAGFLTRALSLAKEGKAAYPRSPGGQNCSQLATQLTSPAYELVGMTHDGAGERSLQVTHRNLTTLHFRAWRIDVPTRLKASKGGVPLDHMEMQAQFRRAPEVEWKLELPSTPDLRDHRTFVTPPLPRKGLWLIAASAKKDFTEKENRIAALHFQQTDLLVRSEALPAGKIRIHVHDAESGKPVQGATVQIFQATWRKPPAEVRSAKTGVEGDAEVTIRSNDYGSYFVRAFHGDDDVIDARNFSPIHDYGAERASSQAFVYTDRTVYRPLQKVMWKVVAFHGGGAEPRFSVQKGASLTVRLRDANAEEIDRRSVKTNAFGSAAGEFTIPAGRLLGGWTIEVDQRTSVAIRVEEYKRPTFEVTLEEPEKALRLNEAAMVKGVARYYFGLPVTAGQLRWRVRRVPDYPWWWHHFGYPRTGEQVVGTGSAPLREDGTFRFTFTPEADAAEAKKGVVYAYTVEVDATDEGGETRSDRRTFRLGFVSVQASISLPGSFIPMNSKETVTLTRTDLDGAPRAGTGAWQLIALKTPEKVDLESLRRTTGESVVPEGEPKVVTEGDRLESRATPLPSSRALMAQWKDGEQRAQGSVTHDAKGRATVELPPLASGAYRLRYETRDDKGATFSTFQDLLVAGDRSGVIPLPLVMELRQSIARVGETGSVLIASGLEEGTVLVEIWRAGTRLIAERLSGKEVRVLSLPIEEKDRGGLSISATLVADHQVSTLDQHLVVPFDDSELELSFSTFRDRLRPGQKETWRVSVKGPKGAKLEAGTAELLAYMYDQALDVFAPHQPPSVASLRPQRYLYRNRWTTYGQGWASVLADGGFARSEVGAALQPTAIAYIASYGIGGMGERRPGSVRMMRRKAHVEEMELSADAMGGEPSAQPAPPTETAATGDLAQGSLNRTREAQAPPPTEPAKALRSDFSETAFFQPHLLLGADGTVSFEFTVPDSVTRWNVWVHGITKDLKGASLQKTAESVKDLMVRPYVPRFLREGDRAFIEVAVNNASDKALTGTLDFDIVDAETEKSVLSEFGVDPKLSRGRRFEVAAQRGSTVRYELKAPNRVTSVAFRVEAKSGGFSDGELRPIPVLPSRMHLVQSRFVTLRNEAKKTMRFDDLAKADDPTRVNDRLVVTVDAQLFASVLNALPYLIEYPYECTEQILNRFVSTAIVSSVFEKYPAVASLAKELSKRKTQLEAFEADDPNRKMLLEETPWLQASRGGDSSERLIKVLDPKIARTQRDASMAKLAKAQTASGGFPWFPGGPPSPYMTTYLLHGLARAAEHGAEVPVDMTQRAWRYLAAHYRSEWLKNMRKDDCCWEQITFLNYVASSFSDEKYLGGALTAKERQEMIDFSFRHWKAHSPYLKGMLALTLHRMNRAKDAELVFASVMDSAKTTEELGTFWAREERSWLWYNDTTESHAFALRVLGELKPKDSRRDGLVQWLLLDKKLNHWKSTRATAESIYALVKYLEAEKALGIREDAKVEVGGRTVTFVFEPDKYTGKGNQVVVQGKDLVPARDATIEVSKTTKGFAFASATWHFSTEKLPDEARGDFFHVERRYFLRDTSGREATLKPLKEGAKIRVGDELEVQLSLKTQHQAEYVHLRDPRGAGFEPVNPVSTHRWNLGIAWYEETRDSGANFFFERLPVGEYPFKYRLRATMAGTFRVGPATVQSMYAPEFNAYSSGQILSVEK